MIPFSGVESDALDRFSSPNALRNRSQIVRAPLGSYWCGRFCVQLVRLPIGRWSSSGVNGHTCKLYYPTSPLGVLWSPYPILPSPKSPSTLLPSNGFYVHSSNCQTTSAAWLPFQCHQHILLLFCRWCWNRWGSSTSYSDTEKSMQSVAAPISSWQAAMANKYHSLYHFPYVR
mgnify:CR=1 FL=1